MKRMGRRRRPFFRINAVDQRTKRDGIVIEQLGWYNPLEKDAAKAMQLNEDRIKHWLSVGARPSDTMMDILAKRGLVSVDDWKKVRDARAKRAAARLAAIAAAPDPKKK